MIWWDWVLVGGLSIVHGVFGVGVVALGVPLFVLLGREFHQVLWLLLPCALVVNSLQILTSPHRQEMARPFFIFCLPMIALGLWARSFWTNTRIATLVLGLLLLVLVFFQLTRVGKILLQRFSESSKPMFFSLLGLMHGLFSVGGGFLTLWAAVVWEEKALRRHQIAFGFFLMASVQLVLLFVHGEFPGFLKIFGSLAVGVLGWGLGQKLFVEISPRLFDQTLSVVLGLLATLLIASQLI